MRIKCTDCGKKFRTQGACEMHTRDKHPQQIAYRLAAAHKVARKGHPFLAGMLGGLVGVALLGGAAIGTAVQGQAVEITTNGVVLKPWVTETKPAARR